MACDQIPVADPVKAKTPEPISRFDDSGSRFRIDPEVDIELPKAPAPSRFRDSEPEPEPEVVLEESKPDDSWPIVDRRGDDRRQGDRREQSVEDEFIAPPPSGFPTQPGQFEDFNRQGDPEQTRSDLFSDWDDLSQFALDDQQFAQPEGPAFTQDGDSDLWWTEQPAPNGHDAAWSTNGQYDPASAQYGDADDELYGQSSDFDAGATNTYEAVGYDYPNSQFDYSAVAPVQYDKPSTGEVGNSYDYEEDDWDDFDPYSDVAPATPRANQARFASHADLNQPDEFEDPYQWSLDDDEFDDANTREPARRGNRRPAPRKSNARSSSGSSGDIGEFFRAHSKVLVIFAVLTVILLLSTVGSRVFARTASAESENPGAPTCASEQNSDALRPASLQDEIVTPPGWTQTTDYKARTGTIDFSKALDLEPVGAEALPTLDRTRFVGGYDREFTKATSKIDVAVYQFAGSICAADYLKTRTDDTAEAIASSEVPGAYTWTSEGKTHLVAASGNRVLVMVGTGFAGFGVGDFSALARTQFDAIEADKTV